MTRYLTQAATAVTEKDKPMLWTVIVAAIASIVVAFVLTNYLVGITHKYWGIFPKFIIWPSFWLFLTAVVGKIIQSPNNGVIK